MDDKASAPAGGKQPSDLFRLDFAVLWTTLRRRLLRIALIAAAAVLAAGFAAKALVHDSWEARCILILHPKNMTQQQEMPYLYQQLDPMTAMEIIKLRRNLEDIIQALKLPLTPEGLYGRIRIEKGRNSDAIHLLVRDADPKRAALIANTLAETFIRSFVPVQNSSASRLHEYYVNQRDRVLAEIRAAETRDQDFRKARRLLSFENDKSLKFDLLRSLEVQQMENRTRLKDLQAKMEGNTKTAAGLPDKVLLTESVKSSLDRQIKDKETELQDLRRRYTDENPKVRKVLEDLEALKKSRPAEGSSPVRPDEETYGKNPTKEALLAENHRLGSEIKGAEESQKSIDAQIETLRQDIQGLTKLEQENFEITRKVDFYKNLLKTVETRIIEAKIAMESNISDFEVLEPASPPPFPTGVKRRYLALAAGIMVFLGLVLLTLVREVLDPTVKSPADLKESLRLPVAGVIPRRDQAGEAVFFASFQIFFNALARLPRPGRPLLAAFGSDVLGAGKSFLIQECLRFLAAEGRRTLWIESLPPDRLRGDSPVINGRLLDGMHFPGPIGLAAPGYVKLNFNLDGEWMKKPLQPERLQAFLTDWSDREVIFWELPPLGLNIQHVSDIVSAADVLFLVAGFRISHTADLKNAVGFLRSRSRTPIQGILTQIDKAYFPKGY